MVIAIQILRILYTNWIQQFKEAQDILLQLFKKKKNCIIFLSIFSLVKTTQYKLTHLNRTMDKVNCVLFKALLICLLYGVCFTQAIVWQCNFDTGNIATCNMVQSSSDNFDWRPYNQSTPSANTGPTSDHTTGSGYFMYIEASDRNVGDYADLDSPSFNSGTYCLKFWYHMYGQHIGKLEVHNVLQNGNSFLRWTKSREGANGVNEWRSDTVEFNIDPSVSPRWRIRFRGIRGGDTGGQPFGDIAIDDITLEDCGPTTVSTSTASTTASTSTSASTSTTRTVAPVTSEHTSSLASSTQGIFTCIVYFFIYLSREGI